jgi:glycosyltransferase involved in cell wall biosynthesis
MLTKSDIISAIQARRLFPGPVRGIYHPNIQAISYRDVLELYLWISGMRGWRWDNLQGNSSAPLSPASNLRNIARDLFFWPIYYLRQNNLAKSLANTSCRQHNLGSNRSLLFLRTDHWFEVKSGGSVAHLAGVITGFRKLNYRVQVVSSDSLPGVTENKEFYRCPPIYLEGCNLPNMPELFYNRQLLEAIAKEWHRWSPGFIYQRYSLGNYTGVALKNLYEVPFICEYNGSFPWIARHWAGSRLFHERLLTRIELLNLKAADVVVVVSQAMKDELQGRGIRADKLLVNPNGVDPEKYAPGINGRQIRQKYQLDGKTVIGFIGTFGKWHGAEVLAQAYGEFLRQYPAYGERVRLLMIGDGPTLPQVRAHLIRHQALQSSVLTGLIPQEEGPAYLASCDILVSPHVANPDGTPFFGSPTKLFEYMAMGKGILASDLEQIGEVLQHGKTAWLVRPGDAEALCQGLKALIDNEVLRNSLGEAARRKVIAEYTWKAHTHRIIEKLHERCASPARNH